MKSERDVASALDKLGAFVDKDRLGRQRARAVEAVGGRRKVGWRRVAALAGGVTVAAASLAFFWPTGRKAPETPPLAWSCLAPGCTGRNVDALPGVHIELRPGARGTSEKTADGSYDLALDDGSARFDVDPARHLRVRVRAGACDVEVVGTLFTVTREPSSRRVDVDVERGRVLVRRKDDAHPTAVATGQTLRVDPEGMRLASRQEEPAPPPPPPSPPAAADPPSAGQLNAPTASISWERLARRHNYRGALAAAREVGLDELARTLSARRLAHLADVARFGGSPADAKQLLLTLRNRFPSDTSALDAAFALGNLESDVFRDSSKATVWFRTYLDESPNGALAQESRGRAMLLLEASRRIDEARSMAREYLAHHPGGPYSASARRLGR